MFRLRFSFFQFLSGGLFFLVLIGTVWLYWQGLQGAFLFDDLSNLESLNTIKDTEQFNETWRFITEGITDALGRPISLLTFAWQAHSWPLYPGEFKYVNLMIHLLNGCLIFWFILLLTRVLELPEKRGLLLALLTASIWLWHPLQVSIVLYVIQRMAQLSTLFTLAGLLAYLYGRQYLAQDKLKTGFFWVSIGVGLGGILATLSKENGILLVLYIIVLELTLLRSLPKPRYWRIWIGIFLYLPLILLFFYFATHIDNLLRSYEIREFTMGERLLTQARILIDYLAKISLLRPHGFTLFHDDFTISHSLLNPPTTLIAVAFIVAMFVVAIRVRYTLPVLAFGILWFLAGHVLESSFIGLMLYFEHRNYLPMVGIIFIIVYGAIVLFNFLLSSFLRKIALFLSVFLLAIIPMITWSQTDLWGKPLLQAVFWAKQHPKSLGAQSHAFAAFYNIGEHTKAKEYAQDMQKSFPEYTAPYLYQITLACTLKSVNLPNMPEIIHHLKDSQYDHATLSVLDAILKQRARGYCQQVLDFETTDKIFKALIHNPNHAFYQPYFYVRYAAFQASEKHYGLAIQAGKQALALKDSINLRVKITKWLMADKQFDEAMVFLQDIYTKLNPIESRLHYKGLKLLEAQIPVIQKLHEMGFEVEEK
jgi:protein O-mannosyl-transferase